MDQMDEFLLGFQKIGKNGAPYEIKDDRIADYLTKEQLNIIVWNGQPYLYRNGVYRRDEDGKILKAHIKALIWPDLVTITRINRVYSLILADYRLTKKNAEINNYPAHWVNFKNGMYDPITQTMREHKPEYYSINQIVHELDLSAEYKGTVADEFIRGIIPDDQDREMFLCYAGYCMTTDTSLQKFLILRGFPGAGKSTLLNLLADVIGEENVSCITLQDLEERFTPTELLGKLLNICADIPKKAMDQVDSIKRITGEDLVKGEYKGGKVFPFRSYAKLVFSANELPKVLDEKSDAFFRRMLLIDVAKKGPYIHDLIKGLRNSMPGFIGECMRALGRVYTVHNKVIDSPNSKRLIHEYHRESDSVQAFLDDCTERKQGERIERTRLYKMYEKYCWDSELQTLSRNGFYSNLRGKGYGEGRTSSDRFITGIDTKVTEFTPMRTPEEVPFDRDYS